MSKATVTSKGQITIPVEVRKRLGIEAGDRIEFIETDEGEFTIKAVVSEVTSLKGFLKKPKKAVSVEQMRAAIRKRATE